MGTGSRFWWLASTLGFRNISSGSWISTFNVLHTTIINLYPMQYCFFSPYDFNHLACHLPPSGITKLTISTEYWIRVLGCSICRIWVRTELCPTSDPFVPSCRWEKYRTAWYQIKVKWIIDKGGRYQNDLLNWIESSRFTWIEQRDHSEL